MARSRRTAATPNGAAAAADLGEAQIKKNRPKDTKLRQQRLPAWQPILNAKTVIPVFFSISILFIPIGIVLLITNDGVKEWSHYYQDCIPNSTTKKCSFPFKLDTDFQGDVYFYYGLENYYQNHRRYMRSRNDQQMLGIDLTQVRECVPFDVLDGKPIAPCGAIANSMFNDTFELKDRNDRKVNWSYEEMVWPVDRAKFRNPKCGGSECTTPQALCERFDKDTVKPPNWKKKPCELDTETLSNTGFQNADFIIWMRTAAFPDFRKPYRKLSDPAYPKGLPRGEYMLEIEPNYNVSSFGGKKSFIISTTSWLGGKNSFLGFAFIAVGILCALIGAIFIFIHLKYGHSLQEMAGVDRNNQLMNRQQQHNHHHAQ